MELNATTQIGTSPPRHTADLRPTADAAALAANPRGAAAAMSALPAALPATLGQAAAISRSLLASSPVNAVGDSKAGALGAIGSEAVAPVQRVLKPWGVAMLPAAADDRRHAARPAPDAPPDRAAPPES